MKNRDSVHYVFVGEKKVSHRIRTRVTRIMGMPPNHSGNGSFLSNLKLGIQVQVPVQCTVSGQKYTLIEEV